MSKQPTQTPEQEAEAFDKMIEDKIVELEAKYKDRTTEIHPVVFSDEEGKKVVGYLMEPTQFTKIRAMDKAIREPYTSAADLFEVVFLRDESDPRIRSVDKFYRGAVHVVYTMLNYSANQFKKKSKTTV